ncbi:MAG TPA: ribosome-associated translation inhibitor RaiA [Alphaproteobacteria bacterium]|nr:ribosome-associated translation inhibitor RaiA [Alphaproteobacteria bacterium]HOO49794.1 ribosome-associated translation inhibitor RaiA [Alphaproteobacteria bacterium]
MELAIHGKQMDVGDALRTHITTKLEEVNAKYFNRAIDITVTLAPEGHGFVKTHISLRVGKDILVTAHATESDAYVSFDVTAEKIAKQLRRYKRRLRDHHARLEQTPETEMTKARDYVLAIQELQGQAEEQEEDDIPQGEDPVIVAEQPMQIQKMSVSDAVMRMDLSGQTAILFRNPKNNHLNMIYRRADGNIGWVEPEENIASAAE